MDAAEDSGAAPEAKAELDLRGLRCPLPVLKARKRLLELAPGAVLKVVADDPAALIDFPHFCAESGHQLVAQDDSDAAALTFWLRRA